MSPELKNAADEATKPRVEKKCSFCGRDSREVEKMVAGPAVYICDRCVELAADICGSAIIISAGAVEREECASRIEAIGRRGDGDVYSAEWRYGFDCAISTAVAAIRARSK